MKMTSSLPTILIPRNFFGKPSISSITHNSSQIHDPCLQPNIFNDFFNSTFTRSDYVLPAFQVLPTPKSQLYQIEINSTEIFQALRSLDTSKAFGSDNMVPAVLKHCSTPVINSITHLLVASLSTPSLPEEWKLHKITPILKKGDPTDLKNYRPISLLCTLSKVLESIVYNKVIDFLGPQISCQQFGFMKKRSCLSQVLSFLADIHHFLENRTYTDVVYFDFRKAFDTVTHNELLFKLLSMGITGNLWKWFKEYLCYRKHFVSIKGVNSTLLPVFRESLKEVLGPLLFLVYVNDIPTSMYKCTTYHFADDTKILKPIQNPNDECELQEDIDALLSCCKKWKMFLHPEKCAAMLCIIPYRITNNQIIH